MHIFEWLVLKSESLLWISRGKKIFFVSCFVFFYTLFSAYFSLSSYDNFSLRYFTDVCWKFILFNLLIFLIVWWVWKKLWWKSNLLDVSLVLSIAQLPFLIFYILWIIFIVLWYDFDKIRGFFAFVSIILTLYILSKILSKIEWFSESKVTIVIVISFIIYCLLWEFFRLVI